MPALNELEQQIQAAQQGTLDEEQFFSALLDAQVFMPILDRHAIGGFQDSNRAEPLVLESEEGSRVVPLFTSPERARDFLQHYPGYEGGLLAEFRWVIERIGSGVGISMNPGLDHGFDLEAQMLEALRDTTCVE
ncbi:MAG TPA: SseB family protein [Gammaproteobacteria bacterium]